MAGLQRSAISFRRQGSSGSVWDDKFLAELNKQHQQELQEQQQKQQEEDLKQGLSKEPQIETIKQEKGGPDQLKRSKSDNGGGPGGRGTPAHGFKAVKVVELEEPPSPKVAACGFCGVFGRSPAKKGGATKSSGKST